VVPQSLIKFVPPAGYYFDANNKLRSGTPTRPDEKLEIWASPTAIVGDGSNNGIGNLTNGQGPVALNNFVPTGAIVSTIIPVFVTTLTTELQTQVVEQMLLYRNFGLGYDNDGTITGTAATWYLIPSTNLDVNATWSLTNAGSTTPGVLDASWLVQFVTQNNNYTVTTRGLAYYFGSVLQTRFFYYDGSPIYDSRSGTVIKDFINVLAMNSQPDSTDSLQSNIYMTIIGQPVESDGYVDDFQVLVSYRDNDSDGVPDNPDFFTEIVAPTVNPTSKLVFFEQIVDFDNLQRYVLVEPGRVNTDYATLTQLELVKTEWTPGQIFYTTTDQIFYELTLTTTGARELVELNTWIARTGRQALYFQYRHNSPLTHRIDPGTTNIIDLYTW
jgi:hypothetical protein